MSAAAGSTLLLRAGGRLDGPHRRSWLLLAASLATWSAGAATWAVSHAVGDGPASASAGDLWYLLTVVLYATAVIGQPALDAPGRRTRAVLDGLIAGAGAAVVLWYVAGRAVAGASGVLSAASAMAYPLVDLGLVVVTLRALLEVRRRSVEESVLWLTANAFGVIAIGDAAGLVARVHGEVAPLRLASDACWIIGVWCLAAASRFIGPGGRPLTVPPGRRQLEARLGTIPTVAAVGAVVAAALDALANRRFGPTGLTLVTTTIGLVLVRQSLTVGDNRRLASSLAAMVDELEVQATHDALTGLPNRVALETMIADAERSARSSGRLAAVLFLDLDHLKAVNDSIGHAAGDHLLSIVADRLRARVGDGVARFGGDEFVVVLDDAPRVEAVEALGRAIVEDLAATTSFEGNVLRPSASIGVALVDGSSTPEDLLRRADVALYRAKARGRRRVELEDPGDSARARRQLDVEPQLRHALEHDEFVVHYQPVVELTTGRIQSLEALLRWRHPDRGLLGPGDFLAEATTAGLLGRIGLQTLRRVCTDHAHTTMPVAVNLSSAELVDAATADRVAEVLSSSGMDPRRLIVEVTEDVIIDDGVRDTLEALRGLGVRLAVDDFGTGNSSLRQLGAYPADHLKLDRSFVSRIDTDHEALAISSAVLHLADELGLDPIAEGVETTEQAALLVQLGCRLAQGFLFSPALPLDELRALLVPGHRFPEIRASVSTASVTMRSSSSDTVGRSSIAPTT